MPLLRIVVRYQTSHVALPRDLDVTLPLTHNVALPHKYNVALSLKRNVAATLHFVTLKRAFCIILCLVKLYYVHVSLHGLLVTSMPPMRHVRLRLLHHICATFGTCALRHSCATFLNGCIATCGPPAAYVKQIEKKFELYSP